MKKINLSDRIEQINYNKHGSRMKIVEYINSSNMIVVFDNGYKNKCSYKDFKNGKVKNPEDKTVCNIGYLGIGSYKSRINGIITIQYKYWINMIERCYDDKYHQRQPTYIKCSVCNDWLNYQNFAKWFDNNYYTIDDKTMCLDKDILVKENKVYSPETCVFVPKRINSLFVKNDINRGCLPIGVKMESKKYVALYWKNNKFNRIGIFNTKIEAFNAYKVNKEAYVKEVANEYKDQIPERLYIAMMNYVVEITD